MVTTCAGDKADIAKGNGKTISIKAIMKSSFELGFKPLYVKSFQSVYV